ncbi:MAG TPA: class I SAM-dependent methyltransferase [Gaiellaceae bacterium]|nr:class I SAM-dependent methyltransferase [Gaiellaceae bacterium]
MPRPAVHPAAAAFDRVGEEYERGRPSFPADAVACLVEALRIERGRTVLDLAAGTGKLTRLLADTGARVVAVEPADGMRRRLERSLPEVVALGGTAEAIPLGGGTVDAVTVAQAFHWFDGDAALAEIHRVLVPGGRLGLVWNGREERERWQAKLGRIMESRRGDTPRYLNGGWRTAFDRTSLFGPLRHARFEIVHELEPEAVVDRVLSVSFVAALPAEERAQVAMEVSGLLASDPATRGHARVELPYSTDVYWCERV